MEQLDPAASVAPQAFAPVEIAKSLGLAPVIVGIMLVRAPPPELDRVATRADEVVPAGVLGKVTGELREALPGAAPMVIELLVTAANPLADAESV